MEEKELQKYIELLKLYYQTADKICSKYPEADREMLVQIMFCLKRQPDQNLGYALLRRGKIHSYPSRTNVS